ncbi:MAG: oxidoreductase [Alphaproteobacteria bacterium]
MRDQSGRVAIVTGANSGLGYVTALALARGGASVVATARSPGRGKEAVARMVSEQPSGEISFAHLDLADLGSIRAFADWFTARYQRLDLLINNAGVMIPPGRHETRDGFELQIGVNHFGHFALTGLLVERLLANAGARVVTVTSHAHWMGRIDLEDLNFHTRRYSRMRAYAQSKLANLLFTYELQRRFEAIGAPTLSLAAHPGWSNTNLQRHAWVLRTLNPVMGQPPAQGALPSLHAATAPDVRGADYFGPDGWFQMHGYPRLVTAASAASDPQMAAQLWDISADSVGVDFNALRSPMAEQPILEAGGYAAAGRAFSDFLP